MNKTAFDKDRSIWRMESKNRSILGKQLGEMPWKFLSCQLKWNCMNNFNHFLMHNFLKWLEHSRSGLARSKETGKPKGFELKTLASLTLAQPEYILNHQAVERTAASMWWQLPTFIQKSVSVFKWFVQMYCTWNVIMHYAWGSFSLVQITFRANISSCLFLQEERHLNCYQSECFRSHIWYWLTLLLSDCKPQRQRSNLSPLSWDMLKIKC